MIDAIERYDQELQQDIEALEKYITRDEEVARGELVSLGCEKEVAEKLARKRRDEGKHLYFDCLHATGTDELLRSMKELQQSVKILPFRITLTSPSDLRDDIRVDRFLVSIITGGGRQPFSAESLTPDERGNFAKYMNSLLRVYIGWTPDWGMDSAYPSLELMKFVADMLIKHKSDNAPGAAPKREGKAWRLLNEIRNKLGG